jgi:hypothetical protein
MADIINNPILNFPKPRFTFPKVSFVGFGPKLFTFVKFLFAFIIASAAAILGYGILSAINTSFDTTVVFVYLVLAYILGNFFNLSKSHLFRFYLLAFLLSFIIPFLPGSLFLFLIIPLLKLFKLISPPEIK